MKHNKKKDPGIPNSWPFKQELLQNIKHEKDRMEVKLAEEKERRRAVQRGEGKAGNLEELMMQPKMTHTPSPG